MTANKKEIRDAERKALAEVRQWRRATAKEMAGMTAKERQEYWQKDAEELRANGYNVIG
jgi:hypothetical protein